MSAILQARGEGLCPINTECQTDSFVGFLEREGYTDIRVVSDKPKRRTPDAAKSNDTSSRRTATVSARRTVTRRPRT